MERHVVLPQTECAGVVCVCVCVCSVSIGSSKDLKGPRRLSGCSGVVIKRTQRDVGV